MFEAGLILEGGGMRGIYTAGVLDSLLDGEIFFRRVYGVSAGACHACSYLSRQRGRAMRTVTDFLGDRRYAGVYSLVTTGDFFGAKFIYDEVPNRLIPFDYDAYLRSGSALTAVLTNCRTGLPAYLPVKDMRRDIDLIRASSSLPMLSRKVELGGEYYLDGGISDSIPLARSIRDGARRNVVVLTQHRGYRKEAGGKTISMMRLGYRRYPLLVEAMKTRHLRYNGALDLIEKEEAAGGVFVIQPKRPVEIDRLEKDKGKLLALYEEGVADGAALLPALRAFLGETKEAEGF